MEKSLFRLFKRNQTREALIWAGKGFAVQLCPKEVIVCSLHLILREPKETVRVFSRDRQKLLKLLSFLGIQSVYIHEEGSIKQHIDLSGRPLRDVLELCQCPV